MRINKILETCLYCKDLDEAQNFYGEILGLKLHSRSGNRHLFFRCGDSMVMIFNPEQTRLPDQTVPSHGSTGSGHIAFSIPENELPQWSSYLIENGIEIEADITWSDGGRSLYFRDTCNNSVELASPHLWDLADVPRS